MANSAWANEAFGTVDKSQWVSRVAVANERRNLKEDRRKTVTHEDDGSVWGPTEQLGRLLQVAVVLNATGTGAFGYDRPHLGECLYAQADEIHTALGLPVTCKRRVYRRGSWQRCAGTPEVHSGAVEGVCITCRHGDEYNNDFRSYKGD